MCSQPRDEPPLEDPPWPCDTEPGERLPERLVAALYLLLRDHVHPGDLEQVLMNVRDHPTDQIAYSNPHLLALARAHATYLTTEVSP